MNNEVIIKDTHRGLWYEDGVLKQVLGAGRYKVRPKLALFLQETESRTGGDGRARARTDHQRPGNSDRR